MKTWLNLDHEKPGFQALGLYSHSAAEACTDDLAARALVRIRNQPPPKILP